MKRKELTPSQWSLIFSKLAQFPFGRREGDFNYYQRRSISVLVRLGIMESCAIRVPSRPGVAASWIKGFRLVPNWVEVLRPYRMARSAALQREGDQREASR